MHLNEGCTPLPRTSEQKPSAFFSINEAAARCGVSRYAIRDAIDRGELRAYQVGKLIKLDPADVENFIRPIVPQHVSSDVVAR